MKFYINAEKVLPDWLIHQVRSYVGDGLIYIPPETRTRRAWGSKSGAKELLEARNLEIRIKKAGGHIDIPPCLRVSSFRGYN